MGVMQGDPTAHKYPWCCQGMPPPPRGRPTVAAQSGLEIRIERRARPATSREGRAEECRDTPVAQIGVFRDLRLLPPYRRLQGLPELLAVQHAEGSPLVGSELLLEESHRLRYWQPLQGRCAGRAHRDV